MGGLGAGFDAPHTAYVSCVSGGSGVGFLGVPPVEEEESNKVEVAEVLAAAEDGPGAQIRFQFQVCAQTCVEWNAMLVGRCLYLRPGQSLPDGSKEAFVALLQYAEEVLQCSHIYVCFRKSASARSMVRTFQFLGFSMTEAGDVRAPPASQFVSLVYTITDDEEDEDDFDLYDDADLIH